MSVLDPFKHALAGIVAGVHSALSGLGADPDSGLTWTLAIAAVVVIVRFALLPLVVHGVRNAHAAARARPHLLAIAERYRGRTDADAVRAHVEERRQASAEHGVSRLGCLPLLLQVPIWISLYHLLVTLADGRPYGALGPDQVASLARATLAGVPLTQHGYAGDGVAHLVVVAGLAGAAALLGFVTQRCFVLPNSTLADATGPAASAQRVVPFVSAGGILVAGGVVPVALLVYWVCGALWTLGQTAAVWRLYPTPGTPAALRRAVRPPDAARRRHGS